LANGASLTLAADRTDPANKPEQPHPATLAVGAGTGRAMLAVSWDTIRLFLHVLAATVWVGGQITLAALVPALRRLGTDIPRAAARRFNQVAWPAFAVLIITGIWNMIAVRSQIHGSYETTLIVKLIVVVISGVSAALHARAQSPAGLAVFGALTGISALAALFLGILLAG
jgi:putative copper export protein